MRRYLGSAGAWTGRSWIAVIAAALAMPGCEGEKKSSAPTNTAPAATPNPAASTPETKGNARKENDKDGRGARARGSMGR